MNRIDINTNITNVVKKYMTSFSKSIVSRFYNKSQVDVLVSHDNIDTLNGLTKDTTTGNLLFENKPLATEQKVNTLNVSGEKICGEAMCGFDVVDLSNFYTREQVQLFVLASKTKETILYIGSASNVGTYTLSDDINNYDQLIIYANNNGTTAKSSLTVDCKSVTSVVYEDNIFSFQDTACNFSILHHFDKDKLIIDYIGKGTGWSNLSVRIYKIIGIKY